MRSCAILTCDDEHLSQSAIQFVKTIFNLKACGIYKREDKELTPEIERVCSGVDFLFSFLCPVIVPAKVLHSVNNLCINFHPAPPAYPGIGAPSYAIYNGNKIYGVTAHLMAEKVDSGAIIDVKRFSIEDRDTCYTLHRRALDYSLIQFYEILTKIAYRGRVEMSLEKWEKPATSRAEFERWMYATNQEITRKVKSLEHPAFPGLRLANNQTELTGDPA